MRHHLLDLPAELQLLVVQPLLQDEDKITDGYIQELQELQDEPLRIRHDLISWSCTCSYFRNLLAPIIFRTTILVNSEESGDSLNAVAESPHNVQVKELHFIGSALGDACSDEAAFWDTEGILPASVETLLRDLKKFPNLEKLSIKFDNVAESDKWTEAFDITVAVETEEEAVEAEKYEAWRALMSKTYSALAQNKPPHFKHLEVRKLIWRKVSSLAHVAFHDFLGHLEQFTLSIRGEQDFVASTIYPSQEYPALMGQLDEYFFNHLAHVTTFTIKATEEGPLGLDGMNHALLRLHADQMPLLKILNLEHIFASPELTNFLVGHKSTLEVVTLRNCYACPSGLAKNGIYWSELFTALVSNCPAHLRHFTFIDDYDKENVFSGNSITIKKQVRNILRDDPARMVFPYAHLGVDRGWLIYGLKETAAAFIKGEDQASWTQLMALMERNQRKSGT